MGRERVLLIAASIRAARALAHFEGETVGALAEDRPVAAALGIGRESARLLMKRARGVIVLPSLNGTGQRQTRRMPRGVLESLLATLRNKRV